MATVYEGIRYKKAVAVYIHIWYDIYMWRYINIVMNTYIHIYKGIIYSDIYIYMMIYNATNYT